MTQVKRGSQNLVVVFGGEECIWMGKNLGHFGQEKFAVGERLFLNGLGGSLFLYLLNQVHALLAFIKVFQYSNNLIIQHSTFPIFQYSGIPIFQYFNI